MNSLLFSYLLAIGWHSQLLGRSQEGLQVDPSSNLEYPCGQAYLLVHICMNVSHGAPVVHSGHTLQLIQCACYA